MRARLDEQVSEGIALVGRVLEHLLTLEILDRALVVGAQAFSALVPLLVVLASLTASDGRSFGDALVDRFDLHGAAADTVRSTFAAPADDGTLTTLGVVVVVLSTLSFARALQRTFELTWKLPRRGMKSTGWGLLWLALVVAYCSLIPLLDHTLTGRLGNVLALAGEFGVWLVTPYLLLARRVPWRRLALQAGYTALGMTALSVGLAIYVPRALSSSAEQFGGIGVAFTLLTLLWAGGFVVVTGAALGSYPFAGSWESGLARRPSGYPHSHEGSA